LDDHGAVVSGGARVKEVLKMFGIRWLTLLLVVGPSGCSLTKVATVPMLVGGAVVSIVEVWVLPCQPVHGSLERARCTARRRITFA